MHKPLTYAGTGVDYGAMDPYKRKAQAAASATGRFVERFGFKVVEWTRGESAFLIETPWGYLAFVIEGLGTKNKVADELVKLAHMLNQLTGKTFYDSVAQCNVAMSVNDMATLGAFPLCFGQHLAVGDGSWFENDRRAEDLAKGTVVACGLSRCAWGPGETPTLRDIIYPDASELSGAAVGWVPDKKKVLSPEKIKDGDAIIFLSSSGIHANGLTMARKIAEKLPAGYLTEMSDGRTYGEALLDPTHIYTGFLEDWLHAGVDIHYAVNITGHGWRKLMRAHQPWTYVVEKLPKQLPIFDFIAEHGPVDEREMYGNFNMGAGFALYVPQKDIPKLAGRSIEAWAGAKYPHIDVDFFVAGQVEKGPKRVVIEPKNIVFEGKELAVR